MSRSRKLLLSTLIDKHACEEQVELFCQTFGESVEITAELCESVADKFYWAWAAENLLSASAWADYKRVTAPARAEYERVTESAWAEYARVAAPAWANAYVNDSI